MTKRDYPSRPIVGVGAVIVADDRAIVVRRSGPPLAGEWSVPGGVLELGETMRQGTEREAAEETGLVVEAGAVLDVFDSIYKDADGRIQYHYVLIDFLCRPVSGELRAGGDAADVRWVTESDLDALKLAPSIAGVIRKGLAAARHGEPVMTGPMNADAIRKLFQQVRAGKLTPDAAVSQLRHMPFEDLGFAKVDHHRALRAGTPEVILGQGKTPAQVAAIFARLAKHAGNVLATRTTPEQFKVVRKVARKAEFHELARCIVLHRDGRRYGKGKIAVVSAGTSDVPIAEEAVVTCEVMGNDVEHFYDVGVAGIHRLLAHREALAEARVVIVCAGMEGALPSVVGGLLRVPVIAVPTSVGYGASFQGLAALLGMLNSCASNVSVVNIDNGFGAGYVASMINRL